MTLPVLSILIPTWNREQQVLNAIRSVVDLVKDSLAVEIVVSDNGSTDNTVRRIKQNFDASRVKLVSHHVNTGFDNNLRTLIAGARGTYGWFLGSDDLAASGSVARILDTIDACPGAIIVGDVMPNHGVVQKTTAFQDFDTFWLDEPGQTSRYLFGATTVRAAFPFISNVVFPIDALPGDLEQWEGTSYTHLHALWWAAQNGAPVVYRNKTLVQAAVGHPDRRDAETLAAVKHAMDNVDLLARTFAPGPDRDAIRNVWRLEYPDWRVKSLEERCGRERAWPFVKQQLLKNINAGSRK